MRKGNITLIKQGILLLLFLWGAYSLYLNSLTNTCVNNFYKEYHLSEGSLNLNNNLDSDKSVANHIQTLCHIRAKVYAKFYDIPLSLTKQDLTIALQPLIEDELFQDMYYSVLIITSNNKRRSSLTSTLAAIFLLPFLIIFGYNRFKEMRVKQISFSKAILISSLGTILIPVSFVLLIFCSFYIEVMFKDILGFDETPLFVWFIWWLLTCYIPYFFAVKLLEYSESTNEN